MTNSEFIRNLSDEELAGVLLQESRLMFDCYCCPHKRTDEHGYLDCDDIGNCAKYCEEWLKAERTAERRVFADA